MPLRKQHGCSCWGSAAVPSLLEEQDSCCSKQTDCLRAVQACLASSLAGHSSSASPSIPTIAAFQVILLSEGHVLFSGPPAEAAPWFNSLGYDYVTARDGNVSDWLLDLVSVGFTKPEVSSRAPDADDRLVEPSGVTLQPSDSTPLRLHAVMPPAACMLQLWPASRTQHHDTHSLAAGPGQRGLHQA